MPKRPFNTHIYTYSLGCLIFAISALGQLVFSTFRQDDFEYLYASLVNPQPLLDLWFHPRFRPGGLHFRPFSMFIFQIVGGITTAPEFFQFVTIVAIAVGLVGAWLTVASISVDEQKRAASPLAFLIFMLLASLASSLSVSIRFVAAGYHDGFVFLFSSWSAFFSLKLYDNKSKLTQVQLKLIISVLSLLAIFSKENGITAFAQPLIAGIVVSLGSRELSWADLAKRSLFVLLPLMGYFAFRFYIANVPLPETNITFGMMVDRSLLLLRRLPDAFAYYSFSTVEDVAFVAIGIAIVNLLFMKQLGLALFLLLFGLSAILPMAASQTYGPNQFSTFVGIPMAILVFLPFLRHSSHKIVAMQVALSVAVLLTTISMERARRLAIREDERAWRTFAVVSQSLRDHMSEIESLKNEGATFQLRGFPPYMDKPHFLDLFMRMNGVNPMVTNRDLPKPAKLVELRMKDRAVRPVSIRIKTLG